ncbi:hypothetical protein [Paradesulfitobacterium ferrireducens]|nr:hypothetical protein [Paradesulfitobacterium ferrireducens]
MMKKKAMEVLTGYGSSMAFFLWSGACGEPQYSLVKEDANDGRFDD